MALELDVEVWAEQQFRECELGDARRTARAVKIGAQFASHPSGSTPEQTESWSDCKAAYNLLNEKDVTFTALAEPHWKQTRARTDGHYLLLGDTTTIRFDGDRQIEGMGIISSGVAFGYLLHSSMMVDANEGTIVGLAGQTIHYRRPVPPGEKQRQRLNRVRESEIWGTVIQQVGSPTENVRFTHVFDRGADNFEVYCHLLQRQTDWVVRAAQLTRLVRTLTGDTLQLGEHLKTLPLLGTYELTVTANAKQTARTTTVEVRSGTIGIPCPRDCGRYAKECGISFLTMNVVEVLERNPPRGQKPLRWVLFTSHNVATFELACETIGFYEKRPLIEEFHKALKTGCCLEERLYETAHAWETLTAFLSIVAVRLLQLKTVAKAEPERPAKEIVPLKWIQMLNAVRTGKRQHIYTIREFMRGMAQLGGHLGRARDGEPGWITLWRGFRKLRLLIRGNEAMNKKCG